MSAMRNLGLRPDGPRGPWERRLLLTLVGAAVFAAVVITAAYYFDVATESDAFCGALCHPNRPELAAKQISTHADVECGICHIGPGLLPKVTAKIYGTAELFALVANTYERPIAPPVERMRPADVVCGQCHWPEKPFGDEVRGLAEFAADESNSATYRYVVLRTDDSGESQSKDPGAHWHVENPVWYVARDPERQDIPWVATAKDGQLVEYQAQDDPLTPEQLATMERREMDCMSCHNRAAHQFRRPERELDKALAEGRVDPNLPFVKREGDRLLTASYPTQADGVQAMEELASFYRSQYADVYATEEEAVTEAVAVLQDIYSHTVFPAMNLDWRAYPDNLGHRDSAGCFRCHDGNHLSAQEEMISPGCTTCHSVPVVFASDEAPLSVPASAVANALAARQPASHGASDFLLDHPVMADDSCTACHGTIQYGNDNSSFCANSACHDQSWPRLDLATSFEHPVTLVGVHAEASCNQCHQGQRELTSLDDCATCHQPPSEPHFGPQCQQCHTPEGFRESAQAWLAGEDIPEIEHGTAGLRDCLSCHEQEGIKPAPVSHVGIPNESCLLCHKED